MELTEAVVHCVLLHCYCHLWYLSTARSERFGHLNCDTTLLFGREGTCLGTAHWDVTLLVPTEDGLAQRYMPVLCQIVDVQVSKGVPQATWGNLQMSSTPL